jgi:SAM-dependent methyltransferase
MARKRDKLKSMSGSRKVCTERWRLRDWYASNLGQWLQESERDELDVILPNLFGYHLLQIGCLNDKDILGSSRVLHRVVVDVDADKVTGIFGLYGRPDALPIESDSVDVVLLPHTLEFEHDPHQVLREVERVLVPEGHVVILGFNPWSIWGIWWTIRLRRGKPPWCGRFRSNMRIKDWLALLGFDTVMSQGYFFRPPFHHAGIMRRLSFMERFGKRWWSIFGGAYVLVGKKRVATFTPIKPRWRPRRSMITADLPRPTMQ